MTTHALVGAGGAAVAVALAGSLFFSVSPTAAREKVVLYLLLTMAPFAVVGPVVGPAIDRFGGSRRWVAITATGGSSAICVLMTDDLNHLLLFPEAFLVLVLAKSYAVAKSALVPTFVASDDLVRANSYLALTSVAASAVAAAPAGLLAHFIGSASVLAFAAVLFAAGLLSALRLPHDANDTVRTSPRVDPALPPALLATATRIAALRAGAGFLVFLLAFTVRREGLAAVWLGAAVAATMAGTVIGNAFGPRLRRWSEGSVVAGCTVAVGAGAVTAMIWASVQAAIVLALVLASAAAAAKLSFDAMVQRNVSGSLGVAFGRFESQFQLAWVAGALTATLLTPHLSEGFLLMAVGSSIVMFAAPRLVGRRLIRLPRRRGHLRPTGTPDEGPRPDPPPFTAEGGNPSSEFAGGTEAVRA